KASIRRTTSYWRRTTWCSCRARRSPTSTTSWTCTFGSCCRFRRSHSPPSEGCMTEREFPWREMVAVLHRRRLLIAQVVIAGVVTVTLGLWMKGPTYRATATMMVTADRAKSVVTPDANTHAVVDQVREGDLNSEATLLRSDALIREVLNPYWESRPPQ